MKKLLSIFLFLTLSIVGFAQHQYTSYVTASGTNTYAVTVSVPTITNYSTKRIHLRFANANSGASTLNVTPVGSSALGAVAIRAWDGDSWEALTGGEIATGQDYVVVYNGTYFELYPSISGGGGGSGDGSVNDSLRVKTVSTTTYTPTQADHNYLIYLTNASTVTITLDDAITTNTSLSFRKDDGAGNVIFISDGTSVLTSRLTYDTDTLKTKYATCTWVKRNSTEFSGIGMFGDASSGGGGGGSGTVTNIATSNGITGGPITTTGTISGVNAAADGSTKGVAAFVANDFDATTGVVGIDYTNGTAASGSVKGFLTSADWTTFNAKQAAITFGTGVLTALGVNIGSAGAPILFNGAGGTPSSINLSNATSYPAATESTSGISELATQAETDGFTDDVRQVTPLKLHTNLKRRTTKTANFAIASSDAGATLDANASSTITCTVDAMSTGDQVFITNRGTANVSFAAGSGVSISGLSALKPGFAAVIDYNASGSATIYGGDVSASGVTVLYKNTNSVSNSSSTETDLYSYTMTAGTLGTDGESLEGVVAGTFAATANNKRIRLKIGTTTVFDSGSLAISSATDWSLSYNIIRVSDTSQKCVGTLTLSNSTTQSFTDYATAAETLSVSNNVKVTGQGTASSDITAEFTKIKKIGY